MIKLFKKLRQQLLNENKLTKYFFYAIGEIVLVVIGILIALQINNWNQERLKQDKIDATLIKIQNDIINDSGYTSWFVNRYIRRDSLKNMVFKNQIEYRDPKNQWALEFLTIYDDRFRAKTGGYDQFRDIISELSPKYNDLILELNRLYTQRLIELNKYVNYSTDLQIAYLNYLGNSQAWYAEDKFNRKISNAQIEFYINNPKFRSQVYQTHQAAKNIFARLVGYREKSIDVYVLIDELLGNESLETTSVESEAEAQVLAGSYSKVAGPEDSPFGESLKIVAQGMNIFIEAPNIEVSDPLIFMSRHMKWFATSNGAWLLNFEKTDNYNLSIINGDNNQTYWKKDQE